MCAFEAYNYFLARKHTGKRAGPSSLPVKKSKVTEGEDDQAVSEAMDVLDPPRGESENEKSVDKELQTPEIKEEKVSGKE